MKLIPYLFFDGRCEEAAAFYEEALGAEVEMLLRFSDCPEPEGVPAGTESKIMHMSMRIGGNTIFASDGHCGGNPKFEGQALSLNVGTADEARRLHAALADGGSVTMELAETFFSPAFGMVADRFGVAWMVVAEPPPGA